MLDKDELNDLLSVVLCDQFLHLVLSLHLVIVCIVVFIVLQFVCTFRMNGDNNNNNNNAMVVL